MYAIVKTGGKQYRVERGQYLLVERLPEEVGASVALAPLLYRSEETVLDAAGLEQVSVTAKVLAHERGKKLRVVKFKPKRGYKRRTGHRQELTRIEITDISMGAAKARKAAKTAAADAVSGGQQAVDGVGGPEAPAADAKPAAPRKRAKPAAAAKEGSEDGA
jgi:large subunit ribosomal protein L21